MASADAMAALRAQLDALQAENAALRAEAAELHGFEWFARFVEWFLGRMVIVIALVGGFSGFLSLGLHVKAIVVAVAIAAYFRRGHVEMLALKILAIGFLVGHLFLILRTPVSMFSHNSVELGSLMKKLENFSVMCNSDCIIEVGITANPLRTVENSNPLLAL